MSIAPDAFVHESALVEAGATIGASARIWHDAHVRAGAVVGARCILGKGVFIDVGVALGDDSKVQNYACVYHGTTLGRGVFVGPHAVITNDLHPRATTPDFTALRDGDWTVGATTIGDGASIGANATILAGVTIGAWAMVGAGAVVTRDVAPYALVIGTPARFVAWLCACGVRRAAGGCARCGVG